MFGLSTGTARSHRFPRTQRILLPSHRRLYLRNLCRLVCARSYRLASPTIVVVFVHFRASPGLHAPTIRLFGFPESKASAPESSESMTFPLADQRSLWLTFEASKNAARTGEPQAADSAWEDRIAWLLRLRNQVVLANRQSPRWDQWGPSGSASPMLSLLRSAQQVHAAVEQRSFLHSLPLLLDEAIPQFASANLSQVLRGRFRFWIGLCRVPQLIPVARRKDVY